MYNFNIWRELTSVTVKTVHFVSWKTPPFWNKFSTKPSICIFIFYRKVRTRLFCYFINRKLKKNSYKITRPDLIIMCRQKIDVWTRNFKFLDASEVTESEIFMLDQKSHTKIFLKYFHYAVPTHYSDIFVGPKKVSLFWKMSLFWQMSLFRESLAKFLTKINNLSI